MTATVGTRPAMLPGDGELIEVREPRTHEEFGAVFALRRRVFGEEQGMIEAGVSDADDARSVHALALLYERPDVSPISVGTGRLTLNAGPNGSALVTWVATLPHFRRRGIGEAVMRFLLEAADRAGAPAVVLSAQIPALPFYRRLGFTPYGQRFTVRGIEHQPMVRTSREL
jgi:predicted GNAT family N-acyltransferase